MKNLKMKTAAWCMLAAAMLAGCGQPKQQKEQTAEVAKSGNPVFEGWYADPEAIVYGDTYWIYPTYSYPFDEQVHFDCFSSKDLVNWTKHEAILDTAEVKWAKRAMWAPSVISKDGKYYFMWSEGGWGSPDYCVAYAIADTPLGPFQRIGKILEQDSTVATSAGHHSVLHVPGSDDYYIVYHRRPLGDNARDHRVTCIDRMEFDQDGYIRPVKITFEGVKAREIDAGKK